MEPLKVALRRQNQARPLRAQRTTNRFRQAVEKEPVALVEMYAVRTIIDRGATKAEMHPVTVNSALMRKQHASNFFELQSLTPLPGKGRHRLSMRGNRWEKSASRNPPSAWKSAPGAPPWPVFSE